MAKKKHTSGKKDSGSRALARKHAREALDMLLGRAKSAESEAVRVSAIKELLDRGLGKTSTLIGPGSEPVVTRIERVIVHPKN